MQFDKWNFDGVFTDVDMPEMNGWEFSGAIRKQDEEILIAVITGWGEAVGSNEQKRPALTGLSPSLSHSSLSSS